MNEKTISSKVVYECDFLTLYEDRVELDNGNESGRVYVKHCGAAAVLPITKDGMIVLTKQFRYPLGKVIVEIPAGKKDSKEEQGLECARRELEEETGYQSNNYEHLQDIHNCVGYSDELIEIFIATDCYKVENPLTQDEDEFVEPFLVTEETAKEMLRNKELTDVKTIIALQIYFSRK